MIINKDCTLLELNGLLIGVRHRCQSVLFELFSKSCFSKKLHTAQTFSYHKLNCGHCFGQARGPLGRDTCFLNPAEIRETIMNSYVKPLDYTDLA